MAKARVDGLLCVDKAIGMSSHDVVRLARRALAMREVGHAGTLDPLATGVLVLGLGEGTKLLHFLTSDYKVYEARIELGRLTDTLDAEGQVILEKSCPPLTETDVRRTLESMIGALAQRAPVFSAIKVGGESLYKKARRGETVQAPVRDVHLYSAELLAVRERELEVNLRCSKGFYVRSFARDLSERLGTVGHLRALRRTASGCFTLAQSVDIQTLQEAAQGVEGSCQSLRHHVMGLAEACQGFTTMVLSEKGIKAARQGQPLCSDAFDSPSDFVATADGTFALIDDKSCLIAIAEKDGEWARVRRGFNTT